MYDIITIQTIGKSRNPFKPAFFNFFRQPEGETNLNIQLNRSPGRAESWPRGFVGQEK